MKRKILYPDNVLTRKMNRQGWETVEQFYHNSTVKEVASRETVRQLILHQKKVIEPIFIKIAEALGFTPNEIKELLVAFDYTDFVNLIGDHQGVRLRDDEEVYLSFFRKLKGARPENIEALFSILESLCGVAGIDCGEEISMLKKTE